MNDDPIRDYLGELGKELGRFARHRRRTLAEVEDHLREAACVLQQGGMTAEDAAREAIDQLGSPDDIVPTAARDRMRVAATALVALVAVGVVAGAARSWDAGGGGTAAVGASSGGAETTRSHPADINTSAGGPADRAMAVFSATRTSSDIVPTSLADSFGQGLSGTVGLQPSLLPGKLDFNRSRLLVSSAAGLLYGVPTSSGHVCLIDSLGRGGCVDSFTHFGGSVSWGVGVPTGGGDPILDGAAPDTVSHIAVNLDDGHTASVTMGRNGFIYEAPTPGTAIDSLTVTYTNGTSDSVTIGYSIVGAGVGVLPAALQTRRDRACQRVATHSDYPKRCLRG
jgi:hypothetical protein